MEKENSVRKNRITFRLTPEEYQKVEHRWKKSTCRKLSDYVRQRLFDKPTVTTTRNQSMDDLVAELSLLKRELSAIGNNFNQSVKRLHTLDHLPDFQRWLMAYDISKQTLFNKVDEIKKLIQKIAESWLQG